MEIENQKAQKLCDKTKNLILKILKITQKQKDIEVRNMMFY